MLRDRGWALWLTGLPASGKTTLARTLRRKLGALGVEVVILDSDEVRRVLTPNPTYTDEERDRFYKGLVDLAQLLTHYGVNIIIAATGSWRAYRRAARKQLSPFAEIWVRCSIKVCRARDPKGLYAKADVGKIDNLPGVGTPYEAPVEPAVTVDTDRQTPEESAEQVLAGVPFLVRSVERRPFRVVQVMTRDPVTVAPQDSLTAVKARMESGGFHHLPVVNGDQLVGIISHSDLPLDRVRRDAAADRVADVMTVDPVTVTPDTSVVEAVQLMVANEIGSLPVLEEGKLVGIVTTRDIMAWLSQAGH